LALTLVITLFAADNIKGTYTDDPKAKVGYTEEDGKYIAPVVPEAPVEARRFSINDLDDEENDRLVDLLAANNVITKVKANKIKNK